MDTTPRMSPMELQYDNTVHFTLMVREVFFAGGNAKPAVRFAARGLASPAAAPIDFELTVGTEVDLTLPMPPAYKQMVLAHKELLEEFEALKQIKEHKAPKKPRKKKGRR